MKIKIKNVEFSYGSTQILNNITMELLHQEALAIIGPNGTGKSTLIKCLDGLLNPQRGSVCLDDKDIKNMKRVEIAKYVGYVPQSSTSTFGIKVLDMVLLGRSPHISWRSSENDKSKALKALQLLGIENLAMKNFNEMSGGQQQKVTIARAIAQEADILLLDEPTSSLDIKHQLEVMELMKRLVKEKGISAIISVHDLNLASRYCDKVIMMNKGKIIAAGKPVSVLTAKNIADVYGVEAMVKVENGRPYIVPLKSL